MSKMICKNCGTIIEYSDDCLSIICDCCGIEQDVPLFDEDLDDISENNPQLQNKFDDSETLTLLNNYYNGLVNDSLNMKRENQYLRSKNEMESGNYAKAKDGFTALNSYKDSKSLAKEMERQLNLSENERKKEILQKGINYAKDDDLYHAISCFDSISGYANSNELRKKAFNELVAIKRGKK